MSEKMAQYWPVLTALLVLAMEAAPVTGEEEILSCYTCASTEADDSCFKDPDNAGSVPVTDCRLGPGQCCIIQRMDDKTNLGTPESFFRGCIQDCNPELIGEMIETPDFLRITYQTYCDEHKCNDGPGNVLLGKNTGDGLFIPGIKGKNGTGCFKLSLVLVALCLLMQTARQII